MSREPSVGKQGLEPHLPVPKTGALTLTPHPVSGDGRNRTGCGNACRACPLLSCHPHGQASAKPLRPAVMVLTLWTCQKPSLYERLAGVEPEFCRSWGPAACPLAHPKVKRKPPRGLPWGGYLQLPLGAYTATTPPIRAASSCEIGFMCPSRFCACHVVIYSW
jgi:hypothetical protein